MAKQINVAMIGLGFGAEFIAIYQAHPNANVAAICRRDPAELKKCGDQFGIEKRYTSYDEVLADKSIDAVHINSPIPDHAWMSLKALMPASMSCVPFRWRPRSTNADRLLKKSSRPA